MRITSIHTSDVARITSGQVIIELLSVVKELVENSIDANSDKIDVTFQNYGVGSVEVSDNGSGIEREDFESLCLKHYTSKLETFEDLSHVNTLGFRGEAMSSLCTVANIKITTCTKSSYPKATELVYDNLGKLVSQKTKVTGKRGTTVTVSGLFHDMPVRQKNFVKHAKREYSKCLSLLMGYLLGYTHIRFAVYNVSENTGKKSMALGSRGGTSTVSDVLTSIFGSNGAHGLVAVDITAENIDARFKLMANTVPASLCMKLSGWISDYSFGMGRGGTDRQFLYINKRPVTHKRFNKVINEVYRGFNTTQSPVYVLNIEVDSVIVDQNVTPDKRMVMVQREEVLCEVLREELTLFYENRHNSVPKSELLVETHTKQDLDLKQDKHLRDSTTIISRDEVAPVIPEEETLPKEPTVYTSTSKSGAQPSDLREIGFGASDTGSSTVADFSAKQTRQPETRENSLHAITENSGPHEEGHEKNHAQISIQTLENAKTTCTPEANIISYFEGDTQTHDPPATSYRQEYETFPTDDNDVRRKSCTSSEPGSEKFEVDEIEQPQQTGIGADDDFGDISENVLETLFVEDAPLPATLSPVQTSTMLSTHRCSIQRTYCLHKLGRTAVPSEHERTAYQPLSARVKDIKQTLEIHKVDFAYMQVVGQFNLGFIVVVHGSKIFIVDQHALDEIYNYEKLHQALVLRAQPLVAPRVLELSPIDEMVLLENMHSLRQNGFVVEEVPDGVPGRRVRLVALPVLKNVVFDDGDLHELMHKLHENGFSHLASSFKRPTVRCTKVDGMIALRACRKSIMIGQSLTKLTMARVVRHLSELEKPWNCPHGRPTMRHLADLNQLSFNTDYIL